MIGCAPEEKVCCRALQKCIVADYCNGDPLDIEIQQQHTKGLNCVCDTSMRHASPSVPRLIRGATGHKPLLGPAHRQHHCRRQLVQLLGLQGGPVLGENITARQTARTLRH